MTNMLSIFNMEVIIMPDYKEMYLTLFNAITTATRAILKDNTPAALLTLMSAQYKTEQRYLKED